MNVPNDNYEIIICVNCHKEYVRRKTGSTKQLSVGIRGSRTKNCSKKCSSEWKMIDRRGSNRESPKNIDSEKVNP